MLPFGRDDHGSMFDPRRKPPPNYFSRNVQLKILAMVFLFLGVLLMMSEARKAKNWQWMWQFSGNTDETESKHDTSGRAGALGANPTVDPSTIDTRPPLQPGPDEQPQEPVVTATGPPSTSLSRDDTQQSPSTATAQLDGWNFVLRRLSKAQRQLLQVGMWSWRHGATLSQDDQAAWTTLLQHLDEHWADYHKRASMSVTETSDQLTDSQRRATADIIEASKSLWSSRKSALEACNQVETASPEQTAELNQLQQILDQRAWAQVQDNAALRAAESEAWYRCWDQLQSLSPQQRAQATGPLNFVQLFSQPKELRGHLVQVRGTARWGYRVNSNEPRFGIEGYVVLGLLPSDGSGSPIVIYCTELPAGFPAIGQADRAGKGIPLDEDVTITGYFFKRWLHRSEGGMNLAPLILGEVTQWQPLANASQRNPRRAIPGTILLIASLAMALLAALAAWSVYRSSCRATYDGTILSPAPDALPPFDAKGVRGNVAETLRKIAEEDSSS